ncbi:hypothetical protein FIBSPDRAFT_104852 [Athelia psychrophila]|uniref:Uncharacterized protein n=1 Tax=Athelia psychrophila TaxID=1759441 RepID=A0A166DAE4_9AGAM|nr:hypothetical protein FIBSPDRAFT_104852 [Fibularhizoctonia sp. CBS 109695]
MLHNHNHNNGVLAKPYALFFDRAYPYILEPLMDHTWDSYFYHHVKHTHSATSATSPPTSSTGSGIGLATKTLASELSSYAFITAMARCHYCAKPSTLIIMPVQMRIAMMAGNRAHQVVCVDFGAWNTVHDDGSGTTEGGASGHE